ncbi:unnamed protein product [Effrenium voratum]|nr:unnamed protein product [Effrenium voratum]
MLAARLRGCQPWANAGRCFASKDWASQLGGENISVDRRFLKGASSRAVLLHDYRDVKFLKRISAAGIAGTLMSSSALAYAITLGMPTERCLMFAFQTAGAALALHAYLRTYVARLVLDPKRSQLLLTGCSIFGAPRAEDDVIYLDHLRPGFALEGGYIKFRLEGKAWDASKWIWFRMPRGGDGEVNPGQQVGHRSSPKSQESAPEPVASGSSGPRQFHGAGLGVATAGEASARPRAPQMRLEKPVKEAASAAQRPQKVFEALKLQDGLPASAQEEQKILDFLNEPAAYGTPMS